MKTDDQPRLDRRHRRRRLFRCAAALPGLLGSALGLAAPVSNMPAATSQASTSKASMSRYVLDPKASLFTIRLGKSGVLAFAGHAPEIVAPAFAGTVTVDGGDIARSSVDVKFEAAGLRVTEKGLPKADVPKVQENMLGPRCLDAARFPTIHFASTKTAIARRSAVKAAPGTAPGTASGTASGTAPGTASGTASGTAHDLELSGALTLHGTTRTVTFQVRVTIADDRLTANGRTTIRQTDFKIAPISVAGVMKVKDEVAIEWSLVAHKQ